MNVDYPANFQKFLKIFSLGRLSFLPNPFSLQRMGLSTLDSPKNFFENEFSGLFITTAGAMLFVWFFSLVVYGIAKILAKKIKKDTALRRLAKKNVKFFEWSGMLMVVIATYMELIFAALL